MGKDGALAASTLHSRTYGPTRITPTRNAEQMSISRSLVRTIWINVGAGSPVRGPNGSHSLLAESRPGLPVKAQNDKVSAARLVVAFLVATKRHIRREYGVNWPGEWERRRPATCFSRLDRLTGVKKRP